jgi:hypothetical protein
MPALCAIPYGRVRLVLAGGSDASTLAGFGSAGGTVGDSSLPCPRSPA